MSTKGHDVWHVGTWNDVSVMVIVQFDVGMDGMMVLEVQIIILRIWVILLSTNNFYPHF